MFLTSGYNLVCGLVAHVVQGAQNGYASRGKLAFGARVCATSLATLLQRSAGCRRQRLSDSGGRCPSKSLAEVGGEYLAPLMMGAFSAQRRSRHRSVGFVGRLIPLHRMRASWAGVPPDPRDGLGSRAPQECLRVDTVFGRHTNILQQSPGSGQRSRLVLVCPLMPRFVSTPCLSPVPPSHVGHRSMVGDPLHRLCTGTDGMVLHSEVGAVKA